MAERDFKSLVSTIPPHRHLTCLLYHLTKKVSSKTPPGQGAPPRPSLSLRGERSSTRQSVSRGVGADRRADDIRPCKVSRSVSARRRAAARAALLTRFSVPLQLLQRSPCFAAKTSKMTDQRLSQSSTFTTPSSQTVILMPVSTKSRKSSPGLSTTGIFASVQTSARMAPEAARESMGLEKSMQAGCLL